jgi:sarcosine oxidase
MSNNDRVVIIGAGIVGSSLAKHLSLLHVPVTLLDRSLSTTLPGSTGLAPGFVGHVNELPTLTELAKRSVEDYKTIPGGFKQVGGLEVAYTPEAVEVLDHRLELAKKYGLPARRITGEEARGHNPAFVKDDVLAGLFFENDGTAAAPTIALHDRSVASSLGAEVVEGDVKELVMDVEHGRVIGVKTTADFIPANRVIVTTGIWTRQLLPDLPVHPVGHPYSHSAERPPRQKSSPFVRWPENHVYGRDHGTYDGIGSYDHPAVSVDASELSESARGEWQGGFDDVLRKAYDHCPSAGDGGADWKDAKPFNGLFSMTPDNLPFVGRVHGHDQEPSSGVWCAVAVWVTSAGGVAQLLAKVIVEGEEGMTEVERGMLRDLDPRRFEGQDQGALKATSLRAYNNIYNRDD